MMRFYVIFLICIFGIGCRALLTQHTFMDDHTYVRIDAPVTVTKYGGDVTVYAIPEKEFVRKIRILGEGEVRNIEIWAQDDKHGRRRLKTIHKTTPLILPIEIFMHHLPLTFKTDAIRIVKRKSTGTTVFTPDHAEQIPKGKIDTVEFYTTVSKDQ
ncbi:MAG: hypothetical protein OXI43_10860 [Candidatus Poribacteria bacterium]|nr:hypothetical protein [Candidatus Poribacteria bacterium]